MVYTKVPLTLVRKKCCKMVGRMSEPRKTPGKPAVSMKPLCSGGVCFPPFPPSGWGSAQRGRRPAGVFVNVLVRPDGSEGRVGGQTLQIRLHFAVLGVSHNTVTADENRTCDYIHTHSYILNKEIEPELNNGEIKAASASRHCSALDRSLSYTSSV